MSNNKEWKRPLKLHLGCGETRLEGYVNIDLKRTKATDMTHDVRHLPFMDESVELIESYHVIEHIPRYDVLPMLRDWHRMLIPGGRVIIECPDLDGACKGYLEGYEGYLNLIYGGQRYAYDTHYFGYNFKRLKKLLEQAGFVNILEKPAQDYHAQEGNPCFRAECRKL